MKSKVIASTLIAAMMLALPGTTRIAAAEEMQFIRVATLAPRDSDLAKSFLKIDRGIREATKGAWGVKLYPSGIAGDEKDVIDKMAVGQMDASIITSIGLGQIVPEVNVLNAPGVISNYKQLEAVQKALQPEWEQTFEKKGFKLLGWGETGEYRWFSKAPITDPNDIKKMRPWVWPASYVMKDIFHTIGATGIPLGVNEVMGGLKTNMIDMIIGTAIAVVALQWHTNLKHVSADTNGVLVGAMIMTTKKWDALPPELQAHLKAEIAKATSGDRDGVRKADEKAYQNLLKRGFIADKLTPEGQKNFDKMSEAVRKHLVGRVYSAELLDRAMKIAAKAGK